MIRIEKLEAEVEDLKATLRMVQMAEQATSTIALSQHTTSGLLAGTSEPVVHRSPNERQSVTGSTGEPFWKLPSMNSNALQAGIVTWEQTVIWYQR